MMGTELPELAYSRLQNEEDTLSKMAAAPTVILTLQ
jgi:hypothetical protein